MTAHTLHVATGIHVFTDIENKYSYNVRFAQHGTIRSSTLTLQNPDIPGHQPALGQEIPGILNEYRVFYHPRGPWCMN